MSESQQRTESVESLRSHKEPELMQYAFALSSWKNKFGGAYYEPSTGVLFMMEDAFDFSGHYEVICMLLEQILPHVVLLSAKAEDCLVSAVEQAAAHNKYGVVNRPACDFSPSTGLAKLIKLGVISGANVHAQAHSSSSHESATIGETEITNDMFIGNPKLTAHAFVNYEASQFSLGAISALMTYLQRGAIKEQEDGKPGLLLTKLEIIQVKKFMHLGLDALSSLQLFDQEAHANLHFSTTKEGLSLFGVLNQCVTRNGELLLRNWLIRPSTEIKVIEARQNEIDCFLMAENADRTVKIRHHLKSLGNISRAILMISSGKSRVGDWSSISNSARAIRELYLHFSQLAIPVKTPLFQKLLEITKISEIELLSEKIEEAIDWSESKINGGKTTIRCGIDEKLDEYRENYAALESQLSHLARKLSTRPPFNSLPEFSINYFPQIGYLCTIPILPDPKKYTQVLDEIWDFQFSTDTETHYKNDLMRDLDHYLGDLTTAINDREIEIIHLLEKEVLKASPILLALNDVLAELDCILSLAKVISNRDWVKPKLMRENTIKIIAGRHPLVEGCVETYISNDTHLMTRQIPAVDSENFSDFVSPPAVENPILVLTGANFSGKSVYLKQVAIIVVLAQLGSYVPAQEACIGIHDAIFTRVTTTESASRNSSAFMIDLQRVSFMLRNCTARSLLLIDEFGKGTDPCDGQALFCGLIEHLVQRGRDCPQALFSTHFHGVFTNGYLPLNLPITYAHMKIVLHSEKGAESEQSPTYLYKLEPGLVSSSHALGCALLAGVPRHVRLKAERVSYLLSRFEILELLDVQMEEDEREELSKMEEVVRRPSAKAGETTPEKSEWQSAHRKIESKQHSGWTTAT
ncbi:hypothetical protein O181_034474 [Austropuccinia psidii MF-1]|uniref:DNA mismatch repair proteins mutS family domain-containing protein n=1 Tax=Austropuccinia psidii MF-1 TaxID=1389203 RepID=A0A9Q3D0T2_9BASI|nr:hypothetical protein [Austropuccinia psidii MF-1]